MLAQHPMSAVMVPAISMYDLLNRPIGGDPGPGWGPAPLSAT